MGAQAAPLPLWLAGAGGLLAGEFLRLVEGHARLELAGLITRAGGEWLAELQPQLTARRELRCVAPAEALAPLAEQLGRGPAVLVLALPHGETAGLWRRLRLELGGLAERLTVVDLSADYRLQDPRRYAAVYGQPHQDAEELARFRYALPELGAAPALRGATRLAAPGCFATALQLAARPGADAGLFDVGRPWSFFGITGSSGSGAKPKAGTHHPHRDGNLYAYGLSGHRHEAELLQGLAGPAPALCFVPHSGPFVRGIHLTAALPLAAGVSAAELRAVYARRFADQPFVELLAEGRVPELRLVVGSNRAQVGLHVRGDQALLLVALDNVLKGGSGQGLQALNLALGWPEELALPRAGLGCL